jgi:cyclopropane-fatty-acyl-phospholipid synthase
MTHSPSTAEHIADALRIVLDTERLPVRLRAWDGSEAGPVGAPVVVIRSRRALRRLVWAPSELGLGRAHVAGDIDIEGDVFDTFAALSSAGRLADADGGGRPPARQWPALVRSALAVGAIGLPPSLPAEEFRPPRRVRRHAAARDAVAVSHHYDVGNDFYALVLGPTMVYSCAVWDDGEDDLDSAQTAKLDLVCRKLALAPGMRLLDVGCGWGSLAIHAARRYGVDVVGISLSAEQVGLAQRRVAEAGLADRVTIRVQDYRAVDDGPFDAISSVGMAEHVGRAAMPTYVAALFGLLRPGGRLLNHAISWTAGDTRWDRDTFIARYVFPDGELLSLGETIGALEAGGFETLDVEALRRHYACTLRAWVERLEKNWAAAAALTSEGRARVWRLYMAASALAFEAGKLGVNQVLARRPGGGEPPLRLRDWR